MGLALSGGGIRSASYSLGVIQALAYRGALPNVDYLSTVSGGGYIGASLTYLLHQSSSGAGVAGCKSPQKFDVSREYFPYVSYPMVGVGGSARGAHTGAQGGPGSEQLGKNEGFKGRLLRRLRLSANYLVPGNGLTFLSLAGVVVRNLAASLAVHVALLVVLFQLFFLVGGFDFQAYPEATEVGQTQAFVWPASNAFLQLTGWVVVFYGLMSFLYVVFTRCFDDLERRGYALSYGVRRHYEIGVHYLAVMAIALLVVGGLPWVHELLVRLNLNHITGWLDVLGKADTNKPAAAGMVAAVVGIIGNVWGFLQARSDKKHSIPTGLVIGVASVLLFLGLLLLVYILTGWLQLNAIAGGGVKILAPGSLVLVGLGGGPGANYLSLHRFYRDRLLELFLPDLTMIRDNMVAGSQEQRVAGSLPGDDTLLGDLCRPPDDGAQPADPVAKRRRGPYHILNANIVLTASQHPRYRPRGGGNFIFSPPFCGRPAPGRGPPGRFSRTG